MSQTFQAVAVGCALVLGAVIAPLPMTAEAMDSPLQAPTADHPLSELLPQLGAFDDTLSDTERVSLLDAPILPAADEADLPVLTEDTSDLDAAAHAVPLRIQFDDLTGQTGLYLNDREVLRLRTALGYPTTADRARVVADRLQAFLQAGGQPQAIRPVATASGAVIRAGADVLLTIDPLTARSLKSSPYGLAQVWTQQIRSALGASAVGDTLTVSTPAPQAETIVTEPAPPVAHPAGRILRHVGTGMASWYGPGFHGRRCANGQRFNMYALTAAHRTLPFGTKLRVTNPRTGKSCIVTVTDRGPFIHNRIVDLSRGAAAAIGMLGSGVARVTLDLVGANRATQ